MSANSPVVQATSLRFRVLHGRAPLTALLLLVLANAVLTKNFYASNNLWNILLQITPTMLVAVGMTFVIATGGIDLSVGSLMAIASAVAATSLGHGTGFAILLGMSVATAIGTANGATPCGKTAYCWSSSWKNCCAPWIAILTTNVF